MSFYISILISMIVGIIFGTYQRNPARRFAVILPNAVVKADILYALHVVFTFFLLYGILSLWDWKYATIGFIGLAVLGLTAPDPDRGMTKQEVVRSLTFQIQAVIAFLIIVTLITYIR